MNYKSSLEILVEDSLKELCESAQKLVVKTLPSTPLPRPRIFFLVEKNEDFMVWPLSAKCGIDFLAIGHNRRYFYGDNDEYDCIINGVEKCLYRKELNKELYVINRIIMIITGGQPKLILKSIRRIQAATEWCKKRLEGRRRHAWEILRQQQKAVDIINAEIAIRSLGK